MTGKSYLSPTARERRPRADLDTFDRLMQRQGGDPPQPDGLMP